MRILAFVVVLLLAACATPEPMQKFDDLPTSATPDRPLTEDLVRQAILNAASRSSRRGPAWLVRDAQQPGRIQLTQSTAKIRIDVDVLYTQKSYTIRYVSSFGLQYSDGDIPQINPNYNRRVGMLKQAIDDELRRY